jgi:hypothetical protein
VAGGSNGLGRSANWKPTVRRSDRQTSRFLGIAPALEKIQVFQVQCFETVVPQVTVICKMSKINWDGSPLIGRGATTGGGNAANF